MKSMQQMGTQGTATAPTRALVQTSRFGKDPFWYKTAIIYELHVRAFCDSNGDGIGDFPGLIQKLDYLQDLGITALWLLPFYPSPLKDDGYDIADYYSINPIYGTLADFKLFLKEAHQRGLRVITELVVNHTSDQHPWFQRSRRAKPGNPWRDLYVWSDSPEKYKEARIIFKDFEASNWSWDSIAQAYFWHRFYSHQPDLNYDNPLVHEEITKVLDFWLDMGVDGLRLDAVPYLYEREGTSCENLSETHQYLKSLRRHMDEKYGDRMLLGEANQWPEDAVSYFGAGQGDECHMAFHFPLMPRLFMAVRMEDRVPIIDILKQTPSIPETSQWALFLRNHDELTLEMVTDEERDYMYRVYAHDAKARINLGIRRRLAPLLGNDRKKIELLNLLLFSLPGTPVLYYGDEIAMGDNIFLGDRNGVRTPMHWSPDRNAGFSQANPQSLYLPIILDPEYHYEAINVEAQQRNSHSLLWWMKRVMILRKRWKAFSLGTMEFLQPDNRKVLAYIRRYESETILVVANLSRFPQPVELDLSAFQGSAPFELFGRTEFPGISDKPYFLTLSPHAAFWFSLEPKQSGMSLHASGRAPSCEIIALTDHWDSLFHEEEREKLQACLPHYLQEQRWFGSKGKEISGVMIREAIPVPIESQNAYILLLSVEYVQGDPELYLLPLSYISGAQSDQWQRETPQFIVAKTRQRNSEESGSLIDASSDKRFCAALFDAFTQKRTLPGDSGLLVFSTTETFSKILGDQQSALESSPNKAEQSNTAILYGDKLILKTFRRLEAGINPDLEVGRFLTDKQFANVPAVAGAIEYQSRTGEIFTLGILHGLVPNSKDAWVYTLDALGRYFERVRTLPSEGPVNQEHTTSLLTLTSKPVPDEVSNLVGTYLESARLLGQRTGELHVTLTSDPDNKDFVPEPYTPFYQRSLYQSMRNLTVQNLQLLRRHLGHLKGPERALAEKVIGLQDDLLKQFRAIYETKLTAVRIRTHGDFHLGQILYTGTDFVIIDFEGEPTKPIGERRIKRSPMRDVAGMIRSFHYATHAAILNQLEQGNLQPEQRTQLEPWAKFWYRWTSVVFLKSYLQAVSFSNLLPNSKEELTILLNAHLLEKAIYEVGYELNNRPGWVKIPLQGILDIAEEWKS